MSRYENGRITPSVDEVARIDEALNVSIDYLLVEDASMHTDRLSTFGLARQPPLKIGTLAMPIQDQTLLQVLSGELEPTLDVHSFLVLSRKGVRFAGSKTAIKTINDLVAREGWSDRERSLG